jgi:hypothetical protein
MKSKPTTFKIICRDSGGCLNHIQVADNERDNDTLEVRVEKRRQQAQRLQQRWQSNYPFPLSLAIVEAYGR